MLVAPPTRRVWLDLILPPLCAFCGDEVDGVELCRRCQRILVDAWPPLAVACRRCGLPRPLPLEDPAHPSEHCGECADRQFDFDSVAVLAVYQGAVREAVVATKRAGTVALAAALASRLAERISTEQAFVAPDLVTFVPSHLLRRLTRGGASGSERIAAGVARRLGVPVAGLLRTTRWVGKQSLLPDERRRENVRGAFAVKSGYADKRSAELRDRRVLLVDDVLTTGATASEVARVLKQAGAESVHLAVVARAVRH